MDEAKAAELAEKTITGLVQADIPRRLSGRQVEAVKIGLAYVEKGRHGPGLGLVQTHSPPPLATGPAAAALKDAPLPLEQGRRAGAVGFDPPSSQFGRR